MNSDAVLIICLFLSAVLFVGEPGEPDLMDAIVKRVGEYQCAQAKEGKP